MVEIKLLNQRGELNTQTFSTYTFCGPNGIEFELLGGCGKLGKSLDKVLKLPAIFSPGIFRLFLKMYYV